MDRRGGSSRADNDIDTRNGWDAAATGVVESLVGGPRRKATEVYAVYRFHSGHFKLHPDRHRTIRSSYARTKGTLANFDPASDSPGAMAQAAG